MDVSFFYRLCSTKRRPKISFRKYTEYRRQRCVSTRTDQALSSRRVTNETAVVKSWGVGSGSKSNTICDVLSLLPCGPQRLCGFSKQIEQTNKVSGMMQGGAAVVC